MKKIILLIATIFCISTSKAQQIPDSIKMFIPEIDSVCSGSSVYIPIKAINFRNVIGMQGSIRWDSTILRLDSAFINTSISFFDSLKLDTNVNLTKNFISYVLVSPYNNSTAKDSTTIFTLRFKIINNTKISTPVFFSNTPTQFLIDTATDLIQLSDFGELADSSWINGKINFIDTPIIIQNGNAFTCIASCIPVMYIWHTYNCSGNLISVDTTFTNAFVSTLPTGTCFSVQCAARYSNGNIINSHSTNNTLPLNLISFNAKVQTENSVALNWQTTNEINVSHFNIQRSLNGRDFINIGKVLANGISRYSFVDDKLPFTNDKLTLNYRLEILDNDGKKQYSEVKLLAISNKQMTISIFPNPAKDFVTISSNQNIKSLQLTNLYGQVIQEYSSINSNSFQIKISTLASGVYWLKTLLKDGTHRTQKLLIEQ